jgi:5-hydroxyisourate hydrolase
MISTHVLDTARGRPAVGVQVTLEMIDSNSATDGGKHEVMRATTDTDGRVRELVPAGATLAPGKYRIRFDTAAYFAALGVGAFYPEVSVAFTIRDATQHYHLPLLLSPYGYSTYRGS